MQMRSRQAADTPLSSENTSMKGTMNTEVKEKWVAALRSGEYWQGKGALRDQADAFCCLGVLVDVVCPTDWEPKPGYECDRAYIDPVDGPMVSVLGAAVMWRAGIVGRAMSLLAEMNDTGSTFDAIADYIERTL